MTDRDIFEELRFDHDRHRRLMEELVSTEGDSPERRSLFDELVADTEAHAAAEELMFYSRLMAERATRDKSAHSIEEHQTLRDDLKELREIDMGSPAWLNKFHSVRDRFEHHMKEEEHGVFQMAGKVLTDGEKRSLVEEFRKAKRKELMAT